MPDDTRETRAAEYDLDPSDPDVILDVVLAEPYLGEEPPLWEVDTVQEARDIHLARVAAKTGAEPMGVARSAADAEGKPERPDSQAREALKRLLWLDPAVVEAKREYMGLIREERARTRALRPERGPARLAVVEEGPDLEVRTRRMETLNALLENRKAAKNERESNNPTPAHQAGRRHR
jgi:hypothetical protein